MADARDYLQSQKVEQALADAVSAVIKERPTNALARIAELLGVKKLNGACYCGAVKITAEGDPAVLAICHCHACRSWGGGLGQAVTMFPADKVKVAGELLTTPVPYAGGYKEEKGTFPKGFSNRKVCAKCYACVMNDHSGAIGKIDLCGGLLDWGVAGFKPGIHVNYPSAIMPIKDGLPKFKDYPEPFGGTHELVDENLSPKTPSSPLTGACYCGAVKITAEGDPAVLAICHCHACRSWGGGLGQAVTMFPADKVKVAGELLTTPVPYAGGYKEEKGTFPKGFSNRKVCAKCYACVMNDHSGAIGKIDLCGGLLDWGVAGFKPGIHVNYPSAIMPIKDGLPKFKDYPEPFGGTHEVVSQE